MSAPRRLPTARARAGGTASTAQIAAIHVLAGKAGMDEETRRDFLQQQTGERTTLALSTDQAGGVIERLRAMTDKPAALGAVVGLTSPAAKKMRALWIAAYDLGLVRDRTDRAMLSFLERQTGVSHTRFFNDPGQATSAIEALKSWMARDAKVEWPAREPWKKDREAGFDEVAASKRAVIDAQWQRLSALRHRLTQGAATPEPHAEVIVAKGLKDFDLADFDAVQKELGRVLRAALKRVRT